MESELFKIKEYICSFLEKHDMAPKLILKREDETGEYYHLVYPGDYDVAINLYINRYSYIRYNDKSLNIPKYTGKISSAFVDTMSLDNLDHINFVCRCIAREILKSCKIK